MPGEKKKKKRKHYNNLWGVERRSGEMHYVLLWSIKFLASYPGRDGGGGKAAWYLMFAHA